jgi:hypothetical protein
MSGTSRIVATFRPQAWLGDQAIDVDGGYEFDCTDLILAMPREEALAIEDHTYEADAVWRAHPISTEQPWHGPFEVEVADAIAEYFARETYVNAIINAIGAVDDADRSSFYVGSFEIKSMGETIARFEWDGARYGLMGEEAATNDQP